MKDSVRKYLNSTFTERRKLRTSASSGNKKSLEEYIKLLNDLKSDVNARIRNLKSAGFDYGKRMTEIRNFSETFGKKDRLLSAKELNYNVNFMYIEAEMAYDFLHDDTTIIQNAKQAYSKRLNSFFEKYNDGENFQDMTDRKFKKFLRWLGNEETQATLEAYGMSDVIVEIGYDIYQKKGKKGLDILTKLMTEFLTEQDRSYDFEKAMEREFNFINVSDTRRKWHTTKFDDTEERYRKNLGL